MSVLVALVCAVLSYSQDAVKPATGEWVTIFNGENLDGWTPKFTGSAFGENPLDTLKVEEGMMRLDYSKYDEFKGRFGHVFYKAPYKNYRFKCEYRFTGKQTKGGPGWAFRNSGIMVHCQDPKSMGKDQNFPVCIEVQLLDGAGRPTGNLCTPGTNVEMKGELKQQHCHNSTSKKFDSEEWVTAEVEVLGNTSVRHFINGELVLEYERPQLDPRDTDAKALIAKRDGELLLDGGWISLQAESHPVDFRNIQIKVLPEGVGE